MKEKTCSESLDLVPASKGLSSMLHSAVQCLADPGKATPKLLDIVITVIKLLILYRFMAF